jgi:pyruvate/2-oxoglutarate dehydrogenase complex dihydrolipoamide acyltransferase (E2) component
MPVDPSPVFTPRSTAAPDKGSSGVSVRVAHNHGETFVPSVSVASRSKPKPIPGGSAPGPSAKHSVVFLTPQQIEEQARQHALALASQRAAQAHVKQQPELTALRPGPTGSELVGQHAPIYAPTAHPAGKAGFIAPPTGPTHDIYSRMILKQMATMRQDPTYAQLPLQDQEAKARDFIAGARGPVWDPSTQWNAQQLAEADQMRRKNIGLVGVILEQVAQGLMPVATAERLAHGQAPSLGSVATDIGAGLALLGPDELLAPARAVKAGLSAYREAGVSVDSVRAAKAALDARKGAKQAKRVFALDLGTNQARKDYAATLKSAGYSRQERNSILAAHDASALAMSRDLGVRPSDAWDRIYAHSQYHPISVTTQDVKTGRVVFAQEGQRPEITNLAHTPDAATEPPSLNFLEERPQVQKYTRDEAWNMEPDPNMLYHGTSPEASAGIDQSKAIHAMPTERDPSQEAVWLTEHPSRAATQGGVVYGIPRELLPQDLLGKRMAFGTYATSGDVHFGGNMARETQRVQIANEAKPGDAAIFDSERSFYNSLTPGEQASYANEVFEVSRLGTFEKIVGLDNQGHHMGIGVWRGQASVGIANHVIVRELTAKEVADLNAVASAKGIIQSQDSVSWGRPLAPGKTGDNIYPGFLVRPTENTPESMAALGAKVDAEFGAGWVGVIHGPEGAYYLVDFSGSENFANRLRGLVHDVSPRTEPISWEGGYVEDARAAQEGAWGVMYQDAISKHPESAALQKAIDEAQGKVEKIRTDFADFARERAGQRYEELLAEAAAMMGKLVPKNGTIGSRQDRADVLRWLSHQARNTDDPEIHAVADALDQAIEARNSPDPESFFQGDNPLLRHIADAQERPLINHILALFEGSDVSTAIHELGHAVEQYLPEELRASLGNDPETIARTFEQYFKSGGIPDEALRPAMEHIAEQMTRIYADAESVPGAKISPEIKAAFDDFFKREIAQRPAFARRLAAAHLPQNHNWRWPDDITGEARALAEKHGVNPEHLVGTGVNGRVTIPDVEKYVFEQMGPEEQLRSLMQGLRVSRGEQEAGYSIERTARFRNAEGHFLNDALPPEERLAAGKSELAGELPKVVINGRARDMTQDSLDHLLSTVLQHPNLMTGQKTRVADALVSLIREGRTPTKSELNLMRHVWGSDTVMSLQDIASKWDKGYNLALSALNIPRSIMSSMDVSFGLRQALVAAFYDPKTWFKAWRAQFEFLSKYTGGGEAPYQAMMEGIHAKANYPLYEDMGLAITDLETEIGLREEQYQSNLAEKLTVKGHGPGSIIRSSGRMYTGMAVMLRTELADKLLVEAAQRGQDIHDKQFLQELGHFINGITGRGDLPGKVLQESAPLLNALFFSPRLLASRVQMLNPRNYIAGDKFVRRQYLRAGLRTFGSLATILGAIKLFVPGAEVGTDWRSSDFGKIKVGDTRIDLGGGFGQLFHLMGMIYTGQKVSSTTGQVQSLTSNKFGQATRADAFVNFFSGKLAPTPGMVNDWMKNRDPQHLGQPFNWKDEAASHFQPLIAQDAWQLYNDPTAGMNGIEAAAAGFGLEATGMGIQTYKATDLAAKPTKKLEQQAKDLGLPAPTPDILLNLDHKAHIDSLVRAYPGDRKAQMKDIVQYYEKTTGDKSFESVATLVTNKGTTTDASQIIDAIRHALVGPSLAQYEAAIRDASKAAGK